MRLAMARENLTPRQPNPPKAGAGQGPIRDRTPAWARRMIDIFTVVLPHVLMVIAIWRLLRRDDLDSDDLTPRSKGFPTQRKPKPPLHGKGAPGA